MCPGCGGLGWIPAGDEQLGCLDCNGTGHAPAPSPETPGTTYTEALDGNTHASGTDGGQNGGSDAASREGAAVLGVQPADGTLADRAPGRVPLAVPVLRSGETRDPVTPPRPAQDAVREAAEVVRTILTAHDARLSESGALTYGPPSKGTGFVAAIQWLRCYDAARGGE